MSNRSYVKSQYNHLPYNDTLEETLDELFYEAECDELLISEIDNWVEDNLSEISSKFYEEHDEKW